MMTTGYTIAGLLLAGALLLGSGVAAGLWLAVKAARPDLLDRRRRRQDRPAGVRTGG